MTQEIPKAYLEKNQWSALIDTLKGMFAELRLKKISRFQLLFELTPSCNLLGITVSVSENGDFQIVARGKSPWDKTSPIGQFIGVLGWHQDAKDSTRLIRIFSKELTDIGLAYQMAIVPDEFYKVPPSTWFRFDAENEQLVKQHTRNLWHSKKDATLLCLPQMNASKAMEG
jgi:hypothetical protein